MAKDYLPFNQARCVAQNRVWKRRKIGKSWIMHFRANDIHDKSVVNSFLMCKYIIDPPISASPPSPSLQILCNPYPVFVSKVTTTVEFTQVKIWPWETLLFLPCKSGSTTKPKSFEKKFTASCSFPKKLLLFSTIYCFEKFGWLTWQPGN